jgi:hypothetical protein
MDTQDTGEPNMQKIDEAYRLDRLKVLRRPVARHLINQLPKGTKEQNACPAAEKRNCSVCGGWHHPKVRHLSYVGHAALTDMLLDADPNWSWEPLAFDEQGLPRFDKSGGLWIRLTVCGVTRLGYGHAKSKSEDFADVGSREKEVIGDAIRNAGMRFGAALELWHKGDLHSDEDEYKKEEQLPKGAYGVDGRATPPTTTAPSVSSETKKTGQEQTPEELAVWLLAGFENCMTAEQVEKTKDLMRKEWPRIKDVEHIKESVAACAANAMARIREEREPGAEG